MLLLLPTTIMMLWPASSPASDFKSDCRAPRNWCLKNRNWVRQRRRLLRLRRTLLKVRKRTDDVTIKLCRTKEGWGRERERERERKSKKEQERERESTINTVLVAASRDQSYYLGVQINVPTCWLIRLGVLFWLTRVAIKNRRTVSKSSRGEKRKGIRAHILTNFKPVRPDWTIYWTLGKFS